MSTKVTPGIEVTLDTTEVSAVPATNLDAEANNHCVDILPAQELVVIKKEYSIVGDAFYAGINSDVAPTWLVDLIDALIGPEVAQGFSDYDLLIQNIQTAISQIDVASNTYVEQINFTTFLDAEIGTHLSTLNSTVAANSASIVTLDTTIASNDLAAAASVTQVRADLGAIISSEVLNLTTAISTLDGSTASSIDALTTYFTDQNTNLSGYADAISGLQTYVGLDFTNSNPNGLGMLARLGTLENQNDGAVEVLSNTYDVMSGIEDPNTNTANDVTILDAMPYVQWSNMTGTGDPLGTTRTYTDYSLAIPASASISILEGTIYTKTNFVDAGTDKYWKYSGGSWAPVTTPVAPVGGETAGELLDLATSNADAAQVAFDGLYATTRNIHIGDVYIMYSTDISGTTRSYIRSYKFIKSAISVPLTDAEGYGWAIVTDTDSQATYMAALQARDMADGKISHFYAWGDSPGGTAPADYVVTTKEAEYKIDAYGNYLDINDLITVIPGNYVELVPAVTKSVDATNVVHWFTVGVLYRKGVDWGDKTPVPTIPGNGAFIAVGDMLTVFDPVEGDTATYWFNGTSWQINSPTGVLSQSKWFVDLDNAVTNPHGTVAAGFNSLKVSGEAYADANMLSVENKFSYDSSIILGGSYYKSGFGLDSSGITQTNDGLTEGTAFDSEFWINAERLVLKSPTYTGISAVFKVTATGIQLGIEHTEATRNQAAGTWISNTAFTEGDMVSYQGSSYLAIQDVPDTSIAITNTLYWQLLSAAGTVTRGSGFNALAAWSNTDPSTITYDETEEALVLYDAVDSGIGMAYPAFNVEDGVSHTFTISYRSDVVSTTGFYVSVGEIDVALAAGNTHVSAAASSSGVQDSIRQISYVSNVAIATTYTTVDITYTPTASAKWASLNLLNGTGMGTTKLFVKAVERNKAGTRGTALGTFTIASTALGPTDSTIISAMATNWNNAVSATYATEIAGDTLVITNPHTTAGWTHIYEYNGSAWIADNVFTVNGNQIVTGTIVGNAISSSTSIIAGSGADVAVMSGSDSTYRLWAGAAAGADADFSVTKAGVVKANAIIINPIAGSDIDASYISNLMVDTLQIAGNAVSNAQDFSQSAFSVTTSLNYQTRTTPLYLADTNIQYILCSITVPVVRTSGGAGSDEIYVTARVRDAADTIIASRSFTVGNGISAQGYQFIPFQFKVSSTTGVKAEVYAWTPNESFLVQFWGTFASAKR